MANGEQGRVKKAVDTLLGREPAPPITGHAAPVDKNDRRQLLAFVISFVLIVALGILVSQVDLFDFSMREIPASEQLPGREVVTPTATP